MITFSIISSDKKCFKSRLLTTVTQIVHTDCKFNTQIINLGHTKR